MSYWTYVNGNIIVSPMGRTQAEKRYILETVLDHLPLVTGSEKNMNVYIIQKKDMKISLLIQNLANTVDIEIGRH